MRCGEEAVTKHDLSSLRVLGTVGEPINPEAWLWYYKVVGKERCYLADTWWQTETGGHIVTPLPGATPTKPGSATLPFFGVDIALLDKSGAELRGNNVSGMVCVRAVDRRRGHRSRVARGASDVRCGPGPCGIPAEGASCRELHANDR